MKYSLARANNGGALGAFQAPDTNNRVSVGYAPPDSANSDFVENFVVQAQTGLANASDQVFFLFKPTIKTQTAPINKDMGGNVGSSNSTANVNLPPGSLNNAAAAGIVIGRSAGGDGAVTQSDSVEINVVNSTGGELGNVINPANPIVITLAVQFGNLQPEGLLYLLSGQEWRRDVGPLEGWCQGWQHQGACDRFHEQHTDVQLDASFRLRCGCSYSGCSSPGQSGHAGHA